MTRIFMMFMLITGLIVLAACGSSDLDEAPAEPDQAANGAADVNGADQPEAAQAHDADSTFIFDFSNGETITQEEGRVRYREARPNFGRAESGGVEFDAVVTSRSETEVTVTGNRLRFYLVENVVVGQNAITDMTAQTVFTDVEGTGLEPSQRVDCDLDGEDANIVVTAIDGGLISGEFDGILLSACRDASIGGIPIEGAELIVSGSFEDVPFAVGSD
ncbi:MAG: hypothetical protein RLP44_29050 [Aggregatilineales bacterium]